MDKPISQHTPQRCPRSDAELSEKSVLPLAYRMGQTAADQLRQIIVPDLIQLVGDVKVQRVSVDAVLAYLRRQQLLFDEQLLRAMFAEADFKHEGSLAVGPLTGALQGR